MLKRIGIADLKPGMMVTQVIEQNGPVKIRKVGIVKSDAMVKGLTEMGVLSLEIDESQSLILDDDTKETQESEQTILNTPTQRLMASDKQVSVADRALSQQFHRSLFMPAIDEMPSKWKLYAQPYAILSAIILIGFGFGFSLMQVPGWFQQISTAQAPATEQSVMAEPTQLVPAAQNAVEQSEPMQNDAPKSETSTMSEASPDSANSDEALTSASTQASTNNETTLADEENVPTRVVNGITLNEGETLLGYNAPELNSESDISTANESQTEDFGEGSFSTDLLARVNQAAAALEQEAQASQMPQQDDALVEQMLEEVQAQGVKVPVTRPIIGPADTDRSDLADNSSLPIQRIDQLPPALLTQMPSMSFSAHMFASNQRDRWVRVNGRRLSEGDNISAGLEIVEIESEKIILRFRGETFSMNALSDW